MKKRSIRIVKSGLRAGTVAEVADQVYSDKYKTTVKTADSVRSQL